MDILRHYFFKTNKARPINLINTSRTNIVLIKSNQMLKILEFLFWTRAMHKARENHHFIQKNYKFWIILWSIVIQPRKLDYFNVLF